jgi:hypothetical protein
MSLASGSDDWPPELGQAPDLNKVIDPRVSDADIKEMLDLDGGTRA